MESLLIPKKDILQYSKEDFIRWVKDVHFVFPSGMSPPDGASSSNLNEYKAIVDQYYHPKIEYLFKQPFPEKFGLINSNTPTEKFKEFLEGDDLHKTVSFIIESLLANKFFFEQTNLVCDLLYSKKIVKSDGKIQIIDNNKQRNVKSDIYLKDCIKKGRKNLFIRFIFILENIQSTSLDVAVSSRQSHAIGIFINLETLKATILDSSYNSSEQYTLLLTTISDYFTNHFKKLGYNINVILPNLQQAVSQYEAASQCSIQGSTGLCSIWTYYSIIISILNLKIPLEDIYPILLKYDQIDRNRLIYRFIYYIYTQHSAEIDMKGDYDIDLTNNFKF